MINVSKQFKNESLTNRAFYVTAKCTLSDGTVLNLEKQDFYNAGNGIVDSSDSSDFPLGVAVEKTATLTLVNDDDRFSGYDFGGSRFVIYLNLQMSDRLETIKRGTFITVKKPATAEKISLTLADHMYLADKSYHTNLVFPASAYQVLQDACQTCGIMLGDASIKNGTYQIAEQPESVTFRAVIGYVAMIAGGNARIDENDYLRILNFERVDKDIVDARSLNMPATDTVDGGTFSSPSTDTYDPGTFSDWDNVHVLTAITNLQYDTDDVIVTGIKTEIDEVEYFYGKDGYVLSVENPLINNDPETALQLIGDEIIGLTMRPFNCQHIAQAYATFMDMAYFSDVKGRTYFTYLTNISFRFNGYTEFSNTTMSAEELNSEFYSGNGIIVEQSKKEAEKLISAYDLAVQQMNQLAANTLGYYYTQVQQADGSIISYRHDKPLLADSKIVYKIGTDGFFVTTDYQGTDDATSAAGKWSSGFNSNGDAVLNILYAIGIQSEWINTRGLTAKDNEGNITFRVDADTGEVTVVATSLSITGKTVEEIAQDNLSDYVNEVFDPAIDNLQAQIDGQIETWFYDYVPTTSNAPASQWTTDTEKEKHLGDLFYIVDNEEYGGQAYRWAKINNAYTWDYVEDTATTKALADAAKAQDTADNKRRVFISTPIPPYDAGDLWWTSTADGAAAIKVCKTGRQSGTYVSTDWIDNKYIDESTVNNAITEYDTSLGQTEVFNKLTNGGQTQGIYIQDGKLYINADYILSGTVAGQRINAKGIKVLDSNNNTTFEIDSNGNVTIRANTFSLQGSTIQNIANSAASSAANSALTSANNYTDNKASSTLSSAQSYATNQANNAYNNSKNYTDNQLANFSPDVDLSQREIFNILTNNGQTQGIYLSGGRIYINATYIDTGNLAGWNVNNTTLSSSSGYNSATLDGGNGRVRTTGDYEVYGGPGYAELYGNRVYADMGRFYSLQVDGSCSSLDISGTLYVSSAVTFPSVYNNTSTTTNQVVIGTAGKLFRKSSSSRRYKNHVRNMDFSEANKLYELPVVWFVYKDGYLSDKDRKIGVSIPGFYAEDVDKYLPDAADYIEDKDGNLITENWDERTIIPYMVKCIKTQNEEIETLKSNQQKILQALSKAGIEVEI